jgi:hypothetical protein
MTASYLIPPTRNVRDVLYLTTSWTEVTNVCTVKPWHYQMSWQDAIRRIYTNRIWTLQRPHWNKFECVISVLSITHTPILLRRFIFKLFSLRSWTVVFFVMTPFDSACGYRDTWRPCCPRLWVRDFTPTLKMEEILTLKIIATTYNNTSKYHRLAD